MLNKYLLIADSGATKTDWRIIDQNQEIQQAVSEGLNPYFVDDQTIQTVLKRDIQPLLISGEVNKVFFYGSGCETEKQAQKLKNVFSAVFQNAEIYIFGDLLAAARATCSTGNGIACISGTGSGACLLEDGNITEKHLGNGIWLGDEGSAGHIGKLLITDYLHQKLPSKLHQQFEKRFADRREIILQKVYREKFPNRYLASFSQFVYHHRKEAHCYQLIYNSYAAFFEIAVLPLSKAQNQLVHFVGKTAFYYSDILRRAANDKGISVGNILEKPIAGLTLFHLEN